MPQISILDDLLKSGRIEEDTLGLPFGRTGSFAITFKIASRGSFFAFRCFLQDRPTMDQRYDAISNSLSELRLPYFVDFEYVERGILVNGGTFPALRMRWADGTPLGIYLAENYADTDRITALQQQVQGLALTLNGAGIAHGDIQGGNLLIGPGGQIMLVDYDGMFVPDLKNLGAIETGHPNFQHPERSQKRTFDAGVDRFSLALMHTVLSALIERPQLWEDLKSNPDKFLIGASDLASPYRSKGFETLAELPRTGSWARSLQAIASAPYEQVPSFNDFLNGRSVPEGKRPATSALTGFSAQRSDVPWYATGPIIIDPEFNVSSNPYSPDHSVAAADEPATWKHSIGEVELIGQIIYVEVGDMGNGLPYARLILRQGNDTLSVDLWAECNRRLAQQGITVNQAWVGSWISAVGTVHGPIGSPTGSRYSMTLMHTEKLERLTVGQARWRTQSVSSTFPQESIKMSNVDSLGDLSSNVKKAKGVAKSASASSNATSAFRAPKIAAHEPPSDTPWPFYFLIALVTIILSLVIVALLVERFSDIKSSGALQTSVVGDSDAEPLIDKCVTRNQTIGFSIINCQDDAALYRVAKQTETSVSCAASLIRWDNAGQRLCLEPIAPDWLDVNSGDCLDMARTPIDCSFMDAREQVTEIVTGPGLCTSGTGRQVPNATPRYLCLEPIVDYSTCVEGENYLRECYEGLGWRYSGCWQAAKGVRLEQFRKAKNSWVVVKRGISRKGGGGCDENYPWTVAFSRKASSIGVKQYRLYFPPVDAFTTTIDDLTVTVTGKRRT